MLLKLLIFFSLIVTLNAKEFLYLSSGETISVKEISQKTGELKLVQNFELTGLSSFTFSPDHKFLYAQTALKNGKKKKAAIATFSIDNNGKLSLKNNVEVPSSVTELKTDRSGLFLAGTRSGKVFIWKLENGIFTSSLAHSIQLEKKTHAVRFSLDNSFLYIPATAPNKIFCLSFDSKTGILKHLSSAEGPSVGASQPRHLTFHKNLDVAYSTQERIKPGIAVWNRDKNNGTMKLIQNIVTDQDTSSTITTADIHLSPDGSFIYISSRDKSGKSNEILSFKIDPNSGQVKLTGRLNVEHLPRSFCLNQSGAFIYVAGQGDDKLGVYSVNRQDGSLNKLTQYKVGAKPIWVETIKL